MQDHRINCLDPFGEPDCESEVRLLGADEYSHYYYPHIRFTH